jgi:hypothetical protein
MSGRPDAFSDAVISTFVRQFALILQDLGYAASAIQTSTSPIRSLLGLERRSGLRAMGAFLEWSDVGRRWNSALLSERGPFLAGLIAPHTVGTVLDLLSGNGSVARSLRSLTGAEVAMVERPGCDAGDVSAGVALDFDHFQSVAPVAAYDTVLLCTVLHHEWEPVKLLDLAARVARRRIILIENCIDDACPADYQELVDLIFNESLTRTSLPCPGSHRSLAGWLALGARYGKARAVTSVPTAPGVPLSHDVIVIQRSP